MAAERRTIWLGVGLVVAISALLIAKSMSDPQAVAGRRNAPKVARSHLIDRFLLFEGANVPSAE